MADSTTTTTDTRRRHKSNRSVEHDSSNSRTYKYQKRSSRSNNVKRMSWTLFGTIFTAISLLLGGSMMSDYFHTEKRKHRMGIMKRARQMMQERQGSLGTVGGNNDINHKNYLIDKGHQSRRASLRGEIDGIMQVARDRVAKQEEAEEKEDKKEDKEEQSGGGGLMSRMFGGPKEPTKAMQALRQEFLDLDHDIRENVHGGIRWCKDELLRDLPGQKSSTKSLLDHVGKANHRKGKKAASFHDGGIDFSVHRKYDPPMAWEMEWAQMTEAEQKKGPKVDYTKHDYQYPPQQESPPERGYPLLEPMEVLMKRWPQDELDEPPSPIVERLMHFDFTDPEQQAMALKYRKAELPFKVTNVPEVVAAGLKWTDDYIATNFDGEGGGLFHKPKIPRSKGNCQESHDNFFAFFTPMGWSFGSMGPPPYRNNDWNYQTWSKHAKYADAKSLSFDQPHFYWQSGVPKTERLDPQSEWTFVSRDLPSFSSPTNEATFFQFNPDDQKGIQCRFGERGVTAATHYDAGRNMIAMMQGAKRYILSPPKECSKLGIVTVRGNTLFRHSLLNFGHITHLNTEHVPGNSKPMPDKERAWLERSKTGLAVETVLKAGEVLYVPSHWFHYITSLQKSTQCNVRSGVDEIGTRAFGGSREVSECVD